MKTCLTQLLSVPACLLLFAHPAPCQVNLMVTDFSFLPSSVETLVYPDRVRFTLGNFGPFSNCDVLLEFTLSRNEVPDDADDRLLAAFLYSACLEPGYGVLANLSTADRSQLTLPADVCGDYYVFLRATPTVEADPDLSNNVTLATNRLTVPVPASIYAVFANSTLATSNMTIYPGTAFAYNVYYGNSWRLLAPGAGFTATFTAPRAAAYTLRVRHATSSSSSCPNNGYAPVNIFLNGVPVVTNYDVAAHHASYWYESDTWKVQAQEGENVLEWSAGNLCTHYWIQRIELASIPDPPRIASIRWQPNGQVEIQINGQPGRTNIVEFSTDLRQWAVATNLLNETGALVWTSPASGGSLGFYRVLELAQ